MNGKSLETRQTLGILALGVAMLATLAGAAPEPANAAPPVNRTYFMIVQGLEERYSWQADCLTFSRREVCTSDGDCGSWNQTESGPDGELVFEIRIGDDEDPARFEGRVRIETRGRREAIGGTARVSVGEDSFTVALSGRSTSPQDCQGQLDFWESVSD